MPTINRARCIICGRCRDECPVGAIIAEYKSNLSWPSGYHIDSELCAGCGACIAVCDDGAIEEGEE